MLHYPGEEKNADFTAALEQKLGLGDYNFQGVWFPDDTYLGALEFAEDANFSNAIFSGEVSFSETLFSKQAIFDNAVFEGDAEFFQTVFKGDARFGFTRFAKQASFSSARIEGGAHFFVIRFGEASFREVTFCGHVEFDSSGFEEEADFNAAVFEDFASFSLVGFRDKASFHESIFREGANFSFASFKGDAHFTRTRFIEIADFSGSEFSAEAAFNEATFSKSADFSSVILASRLSFSGNEVRPGFTGASSLNLQFARIESPQRISFYNLSLRPHWFINVDPREFEFTNVRWESFDIESEIECLKQHTIMPGPLSLFTSEADFTATGVTSPVEDEDVAEQLQPREETFEVGEMAPPYQVLGVTCRRLAVNAEENQRYDEASRFRYMAMDTRRREGWRGPAFWRLSWWYWVVSGYGERVWQAFLLLILIWGACAFLYSRVPFSNEKLVSSNSSSSNLQPGTDKKPLHFGRALAYSAGVMTLQKPEPRPATTAGQVVVTIESIIGPIQAALLALAVRRKFMR